jgi:hypothetical protein
MAILAAVTLAAFGIGVVLGLSPSVDHGLLGIFNSLTGPFFSHSTHVILPGTTPSATAQATGTSTVSATATSTPPRGTATPTVTPVWSVSTTTVSPCRGQDDSFTLTYTQGSGPITWTASWPEFLITLNSSPSPLQGTLQPGGSVTIAVSAAHDSFSPGTITLSADGGLQHLHVRYVNQCG